VELVSRRPTIAAAVPFIAFCLMACSSSDDIASGLDDGGAVDGAAPQADGGAEASRPDAAPTDIDDPNNPTKDTDCDGLTDAEEFSTIYPGGLKTDPGIADTDGDGILDGVELGRTSSVDPKCAFAGDQDPTTRTSPVAVDTDGDKLPDGLEDVDRNGRRDPNETDPNAPDTDGDGLADGDEDKNANGVVDPGETDPRVADTDGDGILDGIEATSCMAPSKADTDGDGIPDGVEDANRNGVVDPSELDPCDASDGAVGTPPGSVCSTANLRPVNFVKEHAPDLQLALPAGFRDDLRQPIQLAGVTKGVLARDDVRQVTAIAFKRSAAAVGSSVTDEEASIRAAALPAATREYARTFTTWDGYPALSARYAVDDVRDLNTFTNALSQLLVPGSSGALAGSAGIQGPFTIQAQYVRRSDASVLVTFAITPASRFTSSDNAFAMADVASGSALAQADDTDAVRCETFAATPGKVDFVFVADDSGSMSVSQQALANAATAMAEQLAYAALDWRIAMVTTSYISPNSPNADVVRGFTKNIHQFRAWLTPNSTCSSGQCTNVTIPAGASPTTCSANRDCWVGISGNGTERPLGAARSAINFLASAGGTEATRFRADANVVVVLLTDARDQSAGTATEYQQYFAASGNVAGVSKNPLERLIPLHGILCPPEGATNNTSTWCNAQEDPRNPRHLDVILANGGVHGSIRSASSIATTIGAIVDSVIASTGRRVAEPPIGASLKVAIEAVENPAVCPTSGDLPRNRTNGFDVDGIDRTISFFGACRPSQPGVTRAAISYRSWNDRSADPDGLPAACQDCNGSCGAFEACSAATCTCECVQSATCGPGLRFDPDACRCVCDTATLDCAKGRVADADRCACVCQPDCGGCAAGTTCNTSSCACN